MAVAHVVSSQSHASASFSVSEASFSWTHTTTTDPQGAVVLVFQGVASADAVTSVTYAGTTMTHVGSARAVDSTTEPGSVDVYFLGSSVPTTDNPTVQVNRTNNTTTMWAVCATQTAATDTEIAGIVLVPGDGAIAQQSVDDGSTGVDSVRYSAVYYGGATPAPAGANSTLLHSNDAGAYGWTAVRETTAGQGSRLVGCTQATSDDRAIVAFAVREVYVPPGPTITAFETANWTSTTTPLTITVTGALTGDKILVLYGGDNGTTGSLVTAATVSTTGGSTSAWTEPEEGLAAGGQAWASSSAADVTADGTVTVSLSRTQGTGQVWGGMALLAHNHGGIGVHARSAPSATETVSLAGLSQDSAVGMLAIDWDDLTTVAFSPSGAVEVERTSGTNVAWYAGYWLAQASGTRSYGIATSSTTNLHIIAVEILAATGGGSVSADAALSGTGTLTTSATGEKFTDAALTATATATATATGSKSVGAALSGTGNLTASATPSRNAAAGLAGTGSLAAAADTSKPVAAALSGTGTLTATATVTSSGGVDAALAGTGTLTATATSVKPVTASLSGTGTLVATTAADKSVSGALSATGVLTGAATSTKPVAANLTATGTLTASATVTTSGASADAALSGTGTLATTAILAKPVAAALNGTATATAQMVVTKSISGVLVGVGSLTASADSAGQVTVRPNTGTTSRPGTGRTIRPNTGTTERP